MMYSSLLKGQIALVTGGSSGIGAEIARYLAQAGATVAINYNSNPEPAEKLAKDIQTDGGEAIALQANVSQESEVKALFSQVCQEFGTVDILINNSGIQKDAPFLEMTLEQWNQVINSIAPGAIKTAINRSARSAWETPEAEANLLTLISYRRIGEGDDIAKAAVWLAFDDSDYVHGVTLFVDGGMTLYPEFERGVNHGCRSKKTGRN